jgi:hypothetical protein
MSEQEQATGQQTAADAATERAVDAHIAGDTEKAAPLFKQAEAAHERAAPSQQNGVDPGWRDGNDVAPLEPMPAAPPVTSETDAVIEKMNTMGGRHADLVTSWGADAPVNIEYARSAFREMSASDPGLIAAVNRSGIGDNPIILEHLAKFGRLSAGMSGDHTIARRNSSMSPIASAPITPRGGTAQQELDSILNDNPPGSASYKSKAVQNRVEVLSRMIAGNGSIVGKAGRNA